MTGEMAWINEDGEDANGDVWATHAAVAKALNARLRPFDVYQGPYIELRSGTSLWLTCLDEVEGAFYVAGDDGPVGAFEMWDEDEAVRQALALLSDR